MLRITSIFLTLVAVGVAREPSAALPGEEVLPQAQTNFPEFLEFNELPHVEVVKKRGTPVHHEHDVLIA